MSTPVAENSGISISKTVVLPYLSNKGSTASGENGFNLNPSTCNKFFLVSIRILSATNRCKLSDNLSA